MDNNSNRIVMRLSFQEFLAERSVRYSRKMTVRLTPEHEEAVFRAAKILAIEPSVYVRSVIVADAKKQIKGDI